VIQEALQSVMKANKKFEVSFVCVYDPRDEHLIEGLQATLPKDAEWIFVKCIQDKTISKTDVQTNLITYKEYRYISAEIKINPNDFNFSLVKNIANQYANYNYIFSIDADERLQIDQHEIIKKMITDYNYGVIAMKVYDPAGINAGIVSRLFKKDFEWLGYCHEQISKNGEVVEPEVITNILIRHDGYHIEKNRNKRNLFLLLKDVENNTKDYWLSKIINICYNIKNKELENAKKNANR